MRLFLELLDSLFERAKEEEWLEELPEDFDPLQFLDGRPEG